MKRRDDLYALIQSLDPTEVRYINLRLAETRKKESDYLRLFKYLRGQKTYSEKQLRERFLGENFVNQLDVKKHYLYDTIIKHLLSYKFNNNKDKRIDEHVEILMQKGLLNQAFHLIEAALKDKSEKEDFSLVLRLLDQLEKLSHYLTHDIDRSDVLESMDENLERYQNHFKYNTLYFKVRSLVEKYTFVRSENMKNTFDQVLQSDLMKSEKKAISISARYLFHEIQYLINASSGYWKTAYEHAEEQRLMVEEELNSDFFLKEWAPSIYPHLISAAIHLNQFSIANTHLNKLQSYIGKTNSNKVEFQFNFFKLMELNKALNIPTLKKEVDGYHNYWLFQRGNMPFTLRNYYAFELAKSFYLLGDLKAAQKANQQVINSAIDAEYSLDLYSFAAILDIILSFEMKSLDLMEVQCRSAKTIMQKRGVYYSLEKLFIEFAERNFIDFSKHPSKTNLTMYTEFHIRLKNEIEGPFNGAVISYFDLIKWTNSLVDRCKP